MLLLKKLFTNLRGIFTAEIYKAHLFSLTTILCYVEKVTLFLISWSTENKNAFLDKYWNAHATEDGTGKYKQKNICLFILGFEMFKLTPSVQIGWLFGRQVHLENLSYDKDILK